MQASPQKKSKRDQYIVGGGFEEAGNGNMKARERQEGV